MKPQKFLFLLLALASLCLATSTPASARQAKARTLVVGVCNSPCPEADLIFATPQEAILAAKDGDIIIVTAGEYAESLVVDKSVELHGQGYPVLDAGGTGTVVTLAAPGITFEGFVVRGSGINPDLDESGIILTAPDILIQDNIIEDVLFGIYVARADRAIVRGNHISSKTALEVGRKGDAVRVWYSTGVTIEENLVDRARDIVLWYSNQSVVRNNEITRGRYGIHMMYCDDTTIVNNTITNNVVGIYTMYSRGIHLENNRISGHHGQSGYALGFKDSDNVLVTHNLLVDNHAGMYIDGMPFSPQGYAQVTENIFAFNNLGVAMLPAVQQVEFTLNTFYENIEQMAVLGGGQGKNTWLKNYWSDYKGFDADEDGWGDLPYRAEKLFENMVDREPLLKVLAYSPSVEAIEFASAAFPVVQPQPKLVDESPAISPASPPTLTRPGSQSSLALLMASVALLATGALAGFQSRSSSRAGKQQKEYMTGDQQIHLNDQATKPGMIQVSGVSKAYGKNEVLRDVSFNARAGEAIALWGENGVGKTTLLKAILGLVTYKGNIRVGHHDVRKQGKQARSLIGYVPQEFVFYDLTVQETMEFYCQIKKIPSPRIQSLLSRVGLDSHSKKPVGALSGGLRQRLALAVALLGDPPVLVLDEPMANLDTRARSEYLALLAGLRKDGKTILLASHRLEEVEALADRVLVLETSSPPELIPLEALRQRVQPQVMLSIWVADEKRVTAQEAFLAQGLPAHLNGRGTVVVQVPQHEKGRVFQLLAETGIEVKNFEIEEDLAWN